MIHSSVRLRVCQKCGCFEKLETLCHTENSFFSVPEGEKPESLKEMNSTKLFSFPEDCLPSLLKEQKKSCLKYDNKAFPTLKNNQTFDKLASELKIVFFCRTDFL